MAAKKPVGVIHLAGGDSVNRYQFGRQLAEIFGLDAGLIESVDSTAFPALARRPKNTTLRTTRMEKELGIAPLTAAQGLCLMRERGR